MPSEASDLQPVMDRARIVRWDSLPNRLKNQAVLDSIIRSARLGIHVRDIAGLAGCAPDTFVRWLNEGRQGVDVYGEPRNGLAELYMQYEAARARGVEEKYQAIVAIGHGGQVLRERVRRNQDGTEDIDRSYSAPQWQALMASIERVQREYSPNPVDMNIKKEITVRIVETDDWRNVDARNGQFIDVESATPAITDGAEDSDA